MRHWEDVYGFKRVEVVSASAHPTMSLNLIQDRVTFPEADGIRPCEIGGAGLKDKQKPPTFLPSSTIRL